MEGQVSGGDYVVGYCHGGMVVQLFHRSLMRMVLRDVTGRKGWRGEISIEHLYVPWARNEVVVRFLEAPRPVEWLLMVDTDMVFEPDTADRLMDSANAVGARVLAGLYFGYCSTSDPGVLYPVWYEEDVGGQAEYRTVGKLDLDGPQRLAACGMGCCLIHREVLVAMDEMYRAYPLNARWFGFDDGRELRAPNQITQMGEDLSFCRRAVRCGYPVWGDSRIRLGHVKRRIETFDTWRGKDADRVSDSAPHQAAL